MAAAAAPASPSRPARRRSCGCERGGSPAGSRARGGGERQRAGHRRAGYRGQGGFRRFRAAGFDAYLVRPVRPQSVLTHSAPVPPSREPAPAARRSAARSRAEPAAPRCCWWRTTTSTPCWRGACWRRPAARCSHCVQRPRGGRSVPAGARRQRCALRPRPDGCAHAGAGRPGGHARHQGRYAVPSQARSRASPPIVAVDRQCLR